MNVVESIKRHEGFRKRMYEDSVGVATIGYGFNLEQIELPKPVAELWLAFEIEKHQKELEQFHWYNTLDTIRQDALLDMHYNLGHTRFLEFKKMIAALENKKYDQAAREMIDSKWAEQVGDRAKTLANLIANQNQNEGLN